MSILFVFSAPNNFILFITFMIYIIFVIFIIFIILAPFLHRDQVILISTILIKFSAISS